MRQATIRGAITDRARISKESSMTPKEVREAAEARLRIAMALGRPGHDGSGTPVKQFDVLAAQARQASEDAKWLRDDGWSGKR
jgi:hypothetical protein